MWATLRQAYESGAVTSLQKIYDKYTKLLPNCHSLIAIKKRAAQEDWDKNLNSDELQARVHRSTMELFAEKGMPPERVIEIVIDGMTQDNRYVRATFLKIYQAMITPPRQSGPGSRGPGVGSGDGVSVYATITREMSDDEVRDYILKLHGSIEREQSL